MTGLLFVLFFAAGVLFALAAIDIGGRINLMAAGLCLMAVAFMLPPADALF